MVNLQEIRIPESFRLFSTISTSKLDQSLSVEGLCEILDSQIPFHFAKVPAYDFHFSLVHFVCRTIFHAFCFLYWSSWNLVPCMQKIFYVRFSVHNDNFKSSFCIWKFLKIWPYDSNWFCQMDLVECLVCKHSSQLPHKQASRWSTHTTFTWTVWKLTSHCFVLGVGGNSLGNLWRRVMIMPPSNDDLQNIVKSWYPNLESLTERLIGGFRCMLFEE